MKARVSLLLIVLFSFCQCNHQKSPLIRLKEEDFDKFLNSFYSDSIFQMSRIIFPLVNMQNDSLANISEQKNSFSIKNWRMLSNDYFKGDDTVITIYGQIYKRKLLKGNTEAEDYFYIEDSGYYHKLFFKLKNGKWYLVDHDKSDN